MSNFILIQYNCNIESRSYHYFNSLVETLNFIFTLYEQFLIFNDNIQNNKKK